MIAIGFLHEYPADERHVGRELSAKVHRLKESQSVALAGGIVVGAERRRHVHDTGALLRRDEVFADDDLVLALRRSRPSRAAACTSANQLAPGKGRDRVPAAGVVITQNSRHARERENDRLAGF